MVKYFNPEFSMAATITDASNLEDFNLYAFFELLKSETMKEACELIRPIKNKDKRAALKRKLLPYVCFAGLFSHRNKNAKSLIKPSGMMCMDIDIYDDDISKIQYEICKCKHVVSTFISPSGGLKILVRIPLVWDNETYKSYYRGFVKEFPEYEFDMNASDISRATYASYDNNYTYKAFAEEFTKQLKLEPMKKPSGAVIKTSPLGSDSSPSGATFGFICTLLRDGKSKEDIYKILDSMPRMRWSEKPSSWKEMTYDNAYNSVRGKA